MKKWIIIIATLAIFMTGCGGKLKSYEEIDYETLMNKFEEKQSFVLFIGAETCDHCTLYKDTLKQVIKKYQVRIFYIDIDKLKTSEISKLKSHINYTGTPTTAFIEKGEETSMYDRIDGNRPMDKVVEKLKKKGYIK